MKRFLKYSAIILCMTLLASLVVVMFSMNKAEAADAVLVGRWDGENFRFGTQAQVDGADAQYSYEVKQDDNYTKRYIEVNEVKYYLVGTAADVKKMAATSVNFIITDDISITNTGTINGVTINVFGCGNTITYSSGSTTCIFNNFFHRIMQNRYAPSWNLPEWLLGNRRTYP